jgi:hypothetical protein
LIRPEGAFQMFEAENKLEKIFHINLINVLTWLFVHLRPQKKTPLG